MVEPPEPSRFADLSAAQIACLRLVAAGVTKSKAIARELELQPGTVDTYLSKACRVLGAGSRQEAAERYFRAQPLDPEKSGSPSGSRTDGIVVSNEARFSSGATGVRWLLNVPPVGGAEHHFNSIEKTLVILRIAIVSLCLLAIIVIAGAGILWLTGGGGV